MNRPQIPNWCSDAEAEELARLAAGKLVLEVGTYLGFSSILMAQAGATVHTVDWHKGGSELGPQDTAYRFLFNRSEYGVEDRVIVHIGRSDQVLARFNPGTFDMAFIDGSHSYPDVVRDSEMCASLLCAGGVMVWHDFNDVWPEVRQAVREFVTSGARGGALRFVDSLAILE